MLRRFCDICGEEISEKESFIGMKMDVHDAKGLWPKPIDFHETCYRRLVYDVKRCIDGEKKTKPLKL